jgi:protein giant-lens (argos)
MQIFFIALFAAFSLVAGDLYLRRSEDSDVAICSQFDICNLVHNHYWGMNSVEKLCKCPEGTHCPATFSPNDGWSLAVNVRTQMKFCSPIVQLESQLEECGEQEVAIRVRTLYHIDQVKNVSASILCNCEKEGPIYWRYHSRHGKNVEDDEKLFEVVDNFQCSGETEMKVFSIRKLNFLISFPLELSKCNEEEFCGFSRLDYGFLYQRCTCDAIHDCRFVAESSEVEEDIESELFYNGLMFKSKCMKNESFEHW